MLVGGEKGTQGAPVCTLILVCTSSSACQTKVQEDILLHSNLSEQQRQDLAATIQVFRMFDTDGDGTISVTELKEALQQLEGERLSNEDMTVRLISTRDVYMPASPSAWLPWLPGRPATSDMLLLCSQRVTAYSVQLYQPQRPCPLG